LVCRPIASVQRLRGCSAREVRPQNHTLSKPEIPLPDRCSSAALSPASGSGSTPAWRECRQTDRHRRPGPLWLCVLTDFCPLRLSDRLFPRHCPLLGSRGMPSHSYQLYGRGVDADLLCRKLRCPKLFFQGFLAISAVVRQHQRSWKETVLCSSN